MWMTSEVQTIGWKRATGNAIASRYDAPLRGRRLKKDSAARISSTIAATGNPNSEVGHKINPNIPGIPQINQATVNAMTEISEGRKYHLSMLAIQNKKAGMVDR
jgi:hypothetical protein